MSGSSLLSQEAAADAYYGFPPGFLQAQGQVESGNGANLGSNGTTFQVSPATAAIPGFGLSSVNGNDPMSVGAYDAALANATGSLGGGLLAYNEGIGTYQRDGGSSATPAYQALATNYGGGSVASGTGATGSGSTTSGGGIMGFLKAPIGDLIGGSAGAAVNGATGSTSQNGTGSTSILSQLSAFLSSGGTADILFVVVGLLLIGAAVLGLVLSSSEGRTLAVAAAA